MTYYEINNGELVTITYRIVRPYGDCIDTCVVNDRKEAYKLVLEKLPYLLQPINVSVEVCAETKKVYEFTLEPKEYAVQFLLQLERLTVRDMKDRLERLWKVLEEYDA